jgi:hypothetical protein
MARNKPHEVPTLASRWSPPDSLPGAAGTAGPPLACVATTYTFHAGLFEGDLLPRFLGLKFDGTEGERPFHVEREQALGTTRVCVLVDQEHVDPGQATLRWDQLAVRVPSGVQHAKITLLLWERCARLVVGSANLTRTGYRRNRETVACLDFFDGPASTPRRLALDALDFVAALLPWVRGTEGALDRLAGTLRQVRERLEGWSRMLGDFKPNDLPRAHFVAALPAREGEGPRSPLDQVLDLWGGRKATEVVVMTPFVGQLSGDGDRVIHRLLQVQRSRDTIARLVVPGQPSQQEPDVMVVNLPQRFRDAWCRAWRIDPQDAHIHVIPPCRPSDRAQRDLHAKGLLLVGERTSLLLCGSSNFSPHGMGIGASNVEANLCFLAQTDATIDGRRLRDRLTDGWEADEAQRTTWPNEAPLPEDELGCGAVRRLPAVFRWAALDQRSGTLTLGLDPEAPLPCDWSVRLPGERARELPALVSDREVPQVPASGRVTVPIPDVLRSVAITCLAISWRDDTGDQTALLPVQVERAEDLLPPEEFRGMTADAIIACLLSGREPAEWVDEQERRQRSGTGPALDARHAVDTSGYTLYRVRRLGRALATLGDRLLRTVRTREALAYRLRQDPLGPCLLAEALAREWGGSDGQRRAALRFGLAEVCLTIAHVGRRIDSWRLEGDPELRPLFAEAVSSIEGMVGEAAPAEADAGTNLVQYLAAVGEQCQRLVGVAGGECHAG